MSGVIQVIDRESDEEDEEVELECEADVIAYALELCPPGMAIEIHESTCDVEPCSCLPRVIVKPMAS